ncbi:hypothetical protein V2G26_011324 [Clonostachys chloroleuca]
MAGILNLRFFSGALIYSLFLHMWTVFAQNTTNNGTAPTISWSPCPSGIPPGVDCGSIPVPLSYKSGNSTAADGNQTVSLFLTRLNSTGNGTQNPLFFNPGGPGVGASTLVAAGQFVPNFGVSDAVRRVYTIIGLDPRGVGYSTPIKCDPNIYNQRIHTFVSDNASYQALVSHNRQFGQSCANLTGPLLNNLDTVHVAKDHELVRRALNATKFNLLGLSYGTLLGQQYLSLFPNTVGRMALDGPVDHSQSEPSAVLTESSTYEATLNQFFQWCDTNNTCALNGNNTRQVFVDLLLKADDSPIPAPSCNGTCQPNVTGEDIRYNVQSFLQFVDLSYASNWTGLGAALLEASNGNATALSTPLALTQNATSIEGSPFSYLVIGCQDWLHQARSATDLELRLQAVQPFAPLTAGATQTYYYQSRCLGWPAPLTNGQVLLNTTITQRAPPVLIAHSVYDPSCSSVWADGVRQQLPNAVSITRNGSGHLSHFLLGDTRAVLDTFLANGTLPPDGSIYQS